MSDSGSSSCVFCLSESAALGTAVGEVAGLPLAALEERRFDAGEFKLRPLESVRGRTAYVLQSLAGTPEAPVADRLLRLLFLLQGLRDAGAARRVALIPYLAFARKDRRTQVRDPVNSRYIAELLEAAGVDAVMTLDVHNPAALDNAFRVPVDHLSALPMMADHFARRVGSEALVVVSPDIGGVKRAQLFREMLETRVGRSVDMAFLEKRRALGVVSGSALVGDVAGSSVIVIDDLCATGGTLIRAAQTCRAARAGAVHVAVTHAPLAAGLGAVLEADAIASMVTTDSTLVAKANAGAAAAGKLTTLSVAPLFGLALRRMLAGQSVAPLLARWPLRPED